MSSSDEYQNRDFWDQPIDNQPFKPDWISYEEWCLHQYWLKGEDAPIPQALKDKYRKNIDEK